MTSAAVPGHFCGRGYQGMGDVSDKRWWGPRIWRILHCLAEISDRPDCIVGWQHMLRQTALVLPCDVCRNHFQEAIRRFRFQSGMPLRHMLWETHSASRVGTNLPESELSVTYGYGGNRGAVVAEVLRIVTEIVGAFRVGRIQMMHLTEWERITRRLAQSLLLSPGDSSSSRRRTGRTR